MNDEPPLALQSYRDWLEAKKAPAELKAVAVRAINAFGSITRDQEAIYEKLRHL